MANVLYSVLLVCLGGFLGAIARYIISTTISKSFPSALPYGTLTVNLAGSFALGLLIGSDCSSSMKLLIGTGFLGAFTTFSTFTIEGFKLLHKGKWNYLIVYYALTYILGIMFAFIGYIVVR